jgi:chorismate synthase
MDPPKRPNTAPDVFCDVDTAPQPPPTAVKTLIFTTSNTPKHHTQQHPLGRVWVRGLDSWLVNGTPHIQPLEGMDALRACERLQTAVWGYDDLEVVPAAHMRAALHAGGLVAGAYVGERLVGFLYGFPAFAHEAGLSARGMHSHMMAVLPEARGLGLGRRLKWFQRQWCEAHGIDWVAWTFDPLQARNARLNLQHLGAVSHEYQVDFYGVLGGELSGNLPTDRLLALWHLTSDRVRWHALQDPYASHHLLPDDSQPVTPEPVAAADVAWVKVPDDIVALRRTDPAAARTWGEGVRRASLDLVARGFEARAFVDGAYRWEPRTGGAPHHEHR